MPQVDPQTGETSRDLNSRRFISAIDSRVVPAILAPQDALLLSVLYQLEPRASDGRSTCSAAVRVRNSAHSGARRAAGTLLPGASRGRALRRRRERPRRMAGLPVLSRAELQQNAVSLRAGKLPVGHAHTGTARTSRATGTPVTVPTTSVMRVMWLALGMRRSLLARPRRIRPRRGDPDLRRQGQGRIPRGRRIPRLGRSHQPATRDRPRRRPQHSHRSRQADRIPPKAPAGLSDHLSVERCRAGGSVAGRRDRSAEAEGGSTGFGSARPARSKAGRTGVGRQGDRHLLRAGSGIHRAAVPRARPLPRAVGERVCRSGRGRRPAVQAGQTGRVR